MMTPVAGWPGRFSLSFGQAQQMELGHRGTGRVPVMSDDLGTSLRRPTRQGGGKRRAEKRFVWGAAFDLRGG